uniref:'chromo' domain containing protein n=1 Tax=Solanum tuberosum TaxID=4113 RepID=M1DSB7_SOLTU
MSFLKELVCPGVFLSAQETQALANPPIVITTPKVGGNIGTDVSFRPLLGSVMSGRSFSEVTDYVKKVEGLRRDDQAKSLAKRVKNSGNFQGSYSRGSRRPTLAAKPIQSVMPTSTGNYSGTLSHNLIQDSQGVAPSAGNMPSFDQTCYNSGEPRHMRRDCPHPRVLDSVQQQSRAVVPPGNSNNGRGHPQGGRGGNQRGRRGRGNDNVGMGNVQPGREVARQNDKA